MELRQPREPFQELFCDAALSPFPHTDGTFWDGLCLCTLHKCDPRIHRRRRWHPTPVLLPGKSQGWRSLVGLWSMGSLRVRHDLATSLSFFTFMHWRRKWQPTPVFLSGNPRDRGACWAAVYGVARSRTRLKQLGSSNPTFKGEFFFS